MEKTPLDSDAHRKKITLIKRLVDPQQRALNALEDDKNGAEWEILVQLTASLVSGQPIDPIFQAVVNAIVAQAVLFDKLPLKPKGRPKNNDGHDGWMIAYRYFALKDKGASYESAVAQVAAEFFKDERQIMRIVKQNKSFIGSTIQERNSKREWWDICAEMEKRIIAEGGEPASVRMRKIFEGDIAKNKERDLIGELDQLIDSALSQRKTADIK